MQEQRPHNIPTALSTVKILIMTRCHTETVIAMKKHRSTPTPHKTDMAMVVMVTRDRSIEVELTILPMREIVPVPKDLVKVFSDKQTHTRNPFHLLSTKDLDRHLVCHVVWTILTSPKLYHGALVKTIRRKFHKGGRPPCQDSLRNKGKTVSISSERHFSRHLCDIHVVIFGPVVRA